MKLRLRATLMVICMAYSIVAISTDYAGINFNIEHPQGFSIKNYQEDYDSLRDFFDRVGKKQADQIVLKRNNV